MSCPNNNNNNQSCSGIGYVTIIVLYILLAIILGSIIVY